jgi:SRSO17 transposase
MDDLLDRDGVRRLEAYFNGVADLLGDVRRKASFASYAMGLLLDGDRKSVEPIAARICGEPQATERMHDRLLNFLVDSTWSDRKIRLHALRHGLDALAAVEPIEHWIIDDTGFLKQGTHSVGVQRQYTGSAGKTTNCQVGVSLSIASQSHHLPIDFELFLPQCWANDRKRRAEARIPPDVVFRTKPQLALAMVDRALEDGVPAGLVLADSGYGDSSDFRRSLRDRGLDYAVGVHSTTKVWRVDAKLRRRGPALSLRALALSLMRGGKFRRVTWRQGTRDKLSSRFATLRVVPFHDDGWDPAVREDVGLVIEWEAGKKEPNKFTFTTLPAKLSKKQTVRRIKERYRTERVYEDLKGEFGLDHYEGRRFPGWHHHISCVLVCNAFIFSERLRRFPPSVAGTRRRIALALAA